MKPFTLQTCAGKLMMVDIPFPYLDSETAHFLQRHQFIGVCLFKRNMVSVAQVQQLVEDIKAVLGEHVLIAIDQEGGAVLRLLDVPQAPSAMALGACQDPEQAYAVGAAVGRGLKRCGINWNFAPSLDVNINPANPMIGDRSFGSDPEKVAALGIAWAKGLENAGVMASVKHFPGHGDTDLDTHLALPRVSKARDVLERTELLPFRQAVAASVGSIMTAHIVFPALDEVYPATLSHTLLTELLRDEWQYQGVVVTDSMDMHAISQTFTPEQAALQAVLAGADVLLCVNDRPLQEQYVQAFQNALDSGKLPKQRYQQATERTARAIQRFPAVASDAYDPNPDHILMQEVAFKAITAYQNIQLPNPQQPIMLIAPEKVLASGAYQDTLTGQALFECLQQLYPQLIWQTHIPEHVPRDTFVLYATFSREMLDAETVLQAQKLFTQPALHLCLWNPYHVLQIGKPALISYGFRSNALVGLSRVLQGHTPTGVLPFYSNSAQC